MRNFHCHDAQLPPGSNYCRCSACGLYFGGEHTFLQHRVGQYPDRRCLAPSAMTDEHGRPRLVLNDRSYWVRPFRKAVGNQGSQ